MYLYNKIDGEVVIIITENMLNALREEIRDQMSERRFKHTIGVENAVEFMADFFIVSRKLELRAAALLHDLTKEYSFEKQLKICNEFGIILRDDEISVPEVLHGITASVLIPRYYPAYASQDIVSSVRWHTTGHEFMTLFDKIVCLADYIEEGREYYECVEVRKFFKSNIITASNSSERMNILNISLLKALNNTINHLDISGKVINQDTINARNWLTKQ